MKSFFLNNLIIIIILTLCYLIYNGYYDVLLYLFLIWIISVAGIWIFAAIRAYKLKDLKTILTGSLLVKLFYFLLIIGFVVKSIDSVHTILFYDENKEKIINGFVLDNSITSVRSDGSTFTSINDNNDGVKYIFTLPYYSSTDSDSLPTSTTKEETINFLKDIFKDEDIRRFKNYDIYFKFQYYNQNNILVREIKINPNEDF